MGNRRAPRLFGRRLKVDRWGTYDIGPGGIFGELIPPDAGAPSWLLRGDILTGKYETEFRDLQAAEKAIEKAIVAIVRKLGLKA
jgi:hypothetical protein